MSIYRAPSRDPSNEGAFSVRLFGFVFNLKAGVEVFSWAHESIPL